MPQLLLACSGAAATCSRVWVEGTDTRTHEWCVLQSKVAEYGGTDNFSDEMTVAMTTALMARRCVYVGATLELDAARAAVANCPPTRKVSLCIEPVFDLKAENASDPTALPAPSVIRVVLKEQDIASTKEAMNALARGKAQVLSHISKPYRIAQVSSTWKVETPRPFVRSRCEYVCVWC